MSHDNSREDQDQPEAASIEMQPDESLTSYLRRLREVQGGDGLFVKVRNIGAITQMFSRPAGTPHDADADYVVDVVAPEELTHRPGATEQLLAQNGIPLKRENWIDLAYFGQPPEEWTQEHENELPPQLRLNEKDEETLETSAKRERSASKPIGEAAMEPMADGKGLSLL
jgi:hypothetical protein